MFRFSTNDPDEFGECLNSGGVRGCSVSALGARFQGEAVLGALPRVTFIFPRIDNTRVFHRNFEEFEQVSVNIPLAEPLRFRTGTRTRLYSTGMAFLRGPGDEFDLTTSHQSSFMGVVLSPQLLTWLTEKLGQPLMFSNSVSFETPEGERLLRYLNFIWREIERGAGFLKSPLATHEIENSIAALFYTAAQSGSQGNASPTQSPRPTYLMRAEEYIRANLTKSLTVLDVAGASGVRPGTLSRAFRKYRGLSTKGFVIKLRLEAVQRELFASRPGLVTVTAVALRFGFSHLGRFSQDYYRTFGEMPSETLRR